jgi:translation initiation factor 2 beta subunit (eIF-2beta)/eIF-5
MKNVAFTISGSRYEIKLEDEFAEFVNKDLQDAGLNMSIDNKPDKLLKAYLKLAKQAASYEEEIELLIETLDSI